MQNHLIVDRVAPLVGAVINGIDLAQPLAEVDYCAMR